MSKRIPSYSEIVEAHKRIEPFVHRTPVLTSQSINTICQSQIWFKCENLQKVGAFKFRGAINAVLSLTQDQLRKGVATHSSGNHAQALALAAKMNGTSAYIVMPDNSPEVKKNAVAGYGAEITYCKPTLQDREETIEKVLKETGATFIHPYDDARIICGQGTAARELLEVQADLDLVMAPVGGGGLLSGTAISTKAINNKIAVIAAEPKGADDAYRSFKSGEWVPSEKPQTIADGLLTSVGELNFQIIQNYVDDIYTVSEESIVETMQLVWERMKIIIEPSSAVPLAAVMENPAVFRAKRIGIIFSGGNVDLTSLHF
jgi:threonine dehydratase